MSAELMFKELAEATRKNGEVLNGMTKALGGLVDRLSKTAEGANASQVFGLPGIRRGEDTMTSRGYSFMKMLGLITGEVDPVHATLEVDVHNRLQNALFTQAAPACRYNWGVQKGAPGPGGKMLAPLASGFFQEEFVDRPFRMEMKGLVARGTESADYDEMWHIRKKQLERLGYGSKALSWLNENLGGALVQPPEMGELIELLRNKEALVNAGARIVPLPPQGRLKYPRQTTPSNTYWVGENFPIASSDLGLGEVTLQARKLAVLIKSPNELIRFASPAAEALMRDDMTKSLALGLDLACLEGGGGDFRPEGLIIKQGINRVASSSPGANGDRIVGQDIYRMIAAVEESNAEFEGFIMRPKTLYKYYQLRADSINQGDGAGPFLFNLIREGGDGFKPKLAGHDVTKSTQISQVRAKGNASNLTYVIGGMWSDTLLGMFGAIEFAATTMGDTPFVNDQTWVRGIISADFQVRHEAGFVLMDNLDTTI